MAILVCAWFGLLLVALSNSLAYVSIWPKKIIIIEHDIDVCLRLVFSVESIKLNLFSTDT